MLQLFKERLLEKKHIVGQSQKIIRDMIDTLFLILQLPNLLLLSLSTCKHTSMASGATILVFTEMLKARNCELKTTHNTFRDCYVRVFFLTFFF